MVKNTDRQNAARALPTEETWNLLLNTTIRDHCDGKHGFFVEHNHVSEITLPPLHEIMGATMDDLISVRVRSTEPTRSTGAPWTGRKLSIEDLIAGMIDAEGRYVTGEMHQQRRTTKKPRVYCNARVRAVLPKRARGQTAPHEPSRGPIEPVPTTPHFPVGATTPAPNEPTAERIDAPPEEPARALIAHPPRRGAIASQPGASVWDTSGVSPVSRAPPTAPHGSSTSHEPPSPRTIVEMFRRRRAEEVALQQKKNEEVLEITGGYTKLHAELTRSRDRGAELQAELDRSRDRGAELQDRGAELQAELDRSRDRVTELETTLQEERIRSNETLADLDLLLNAQEAGHNALMTRLQDQMRRIDDAARPSALRAPASRS
jgi:hypothetical protein